MPKLNPPPLPSKAAYPVFVFVLVGSTIIYLVPRL